MSIPPDPDGLVTIDRYYHPTEAHIAAGRLEAEGIPVFLLGINHASANWLMSNALGGIQLQVPFKVATKAREILAADDALDEPAEDRCPQCDSPRTSATKASWNLSFLAVHLLNLPLPWRKARRSCSECGHIWSEARDA